MNPVLAIVPMKEHSQRIPGKNVKLFNNKPLYHWTLDALGQVERIKTIIVDTDSDSIARSVKKYPKVEISIRPGHLRGDYVSVNKLIAHVMEKNPQFYYFLQTHVTNPLLKTATIESAIDRFFDSGDYDSLFSVTAHYTRFYTHDNHPVNHNPTELLRTQDLKPLLEENSNLYIFSRESFHRTRARIGQKPFLFEMDKLEAMDIDEMEDFLLAEAVMKLKTF